MNKSNAESPYSVRFDHTVTAGFSTVITDQLQQGSGYEQEKVAITRGHAHFRCEHKCVRLDMDVCAVACGETCDDCASQAQAGYVKKAGLGVYPAEKLRCKRLV